MTLLFSLIYRLLDLFDLLLLVYCVLSWFPIPANEIVMLLRRIMEPVLTPIRRVLSRYLPRTMMIDLSPVVAWVLLRLIRRVLLFLL